MSNRTMRWGVLALSVVLCALLAGCSGTHPTAKDPASAAASGVPAELRDVAMARPGKVKTPLFTQDLLVYSQDPLPASVVDAIKAVPGVQAVVQFSMASFFVEEQEVSYAAVDPATFRRFTPAGTAQDNDVWDRVADGELAVTPSLRDAIAVHDDQVKVGDDQDARTLRVGALAPFTAQLNAPVVNAVVNQRWAAKLGMPAGNALLVSTGSTEPSKIKPMLASLAGTQATVQILGPGRNLDPSVAQTAVLTGGSVAREVGSFTYTVNSNGTVNPDPRWIHQYIRTEQVPIIGAVTCNKVMLPQLRAALTDIVNLHLASKIHKSQYGGCFVPRFIARDPAKGLSFHTWGTAIDLNVPENQRGTVGLMDRDVVRIFERWGFTWGGTWSYTDPMHFQLARLVKVR